MYHVGQCNRAQFSNSLTSAMSYNQKRLSNKQSLVEFWDIELATNSPMSSQYSYYLNFTVAQLSSSSQKFTIRLENPDTDTNTTQDLRTFTAPSGTGSTTFELIFSPNTSYNAVVFELTRGSSDFYWSNSDGTTGRIMNITVNAFSLVNNIITTLQSEYSGLTTLRKIGVQGPPGLVFTIDGEEFKLGKTGVFELYNEEVEISYIGFVTNKNSLVTQNGQDFFILDFKY